MDGGGSAQGVHKQQRQAELQREVEYKYKAKGMMDDMTWQQVETVVQKLAGEGMINIMEGLIQSREYEFKKREEVRQMMFFTVGRNIMFKHLQNQLSTLVQAVSQNRCISRRRGVLSLMG